MALYGLQACDSYPLGYRTEAAIWEVPRLYGKGVHLLREHRLRGRGLLGYSPGMEAGERHATLTLCLAEACRCHCFLGGGGGGGIFTLSISHTPGPVSPAGELLHMHMMPRFWWPLPRRRPLIGWL